MDNEGESSDFDECFECSGDLGMLGLVRTRWRRPRKQPILFSLGRHFHIDSVNLLLFIMISKNNDVVTPFLEIQNTTIFTNRRHNLLNIENYIVSDF